MEDYNDIGISRQLDWNRIRKLLLIGFLAALMTFVGDMLLGWGVEDEALNGLERMTSAYTGASDTGIFAAALLGLFGITLEGLCYFGIYRLMAEKAASHAHRYRAGIFGYVIFGACGFHVPVCALAFLAKHLGWSDLVWQYAYFFLLPALVLFWIFFLVLQITQIQAFAKRLTPYPGWCWIFSLPVGMAAALLCGVFGNQPWVNAVCCAWISVGNLWMFGGLLLMSHKIRGRKNKTKAA